MACSCTRSVPVTRPEEAGRCPGALRVRNSLPRCASRGLPQVHVERALAGGAASAGTRSRLAEPSGASAGSRSRVSTLASREGRVDEVLWESLEGPFGLPSTDSGPGGTPSQVISLSLRPAFPFQHPQRRLPSFFFALVIMGRKLDPTKKEKRGPGRKARKQKGAETELVRFLPAGEGCSSLIPPSLCSIVCHNFSFACPSLGPAA